MRTPGRINKEDLLARVDLLDVVAHDTTMQRPYKGAKQYCGPCPFPGCGGEDRFIVWDNEEPQRYFCRQCRRTGNAIDYLVYHDGLTFPEAATILQQMAEGKPIADRKPRTDQTVPPPAAWQKQAVARLKGWKDILLHQPEGAGALAWLNKRGITKETADAWGLGFNPEPEHYERGDEWGLQPDRDGNIPAVYIWRGITLPWYAPGDLWGVRVRRVWNPATGKLYEAEDRYRFITGGHPFLFGLNRIHAAPEVLVLTEGEFDCMLAWQEAGDLATFATLGSAALGQLIPAVLAQLLRAKYIITLFDADLAGRKGSAALANQIAGRVVYQIAPPDGKDITDYHKAGNNLRAWIGAAICEGLVQACDHLGMADDDVLARLSHRIGHIDAQARQPRQPDTPQAA